MEEALQLAQGGALKSSPIIIRLHHYVTRKGAYAAEIARARGNAAPEPLEGPQIYARLLEAYEAMAADAKQLKPLIVSVLKNGQFYPGE